MLRYADETASAEFLLIDDGSTDNGKRFFAFVREAERLLLVDIRGGCVRRSVG